MLQGAIIIGLLFVTFIAWIPNHAASYLGPQSDIAGELAYYLLTITVWLAKLAVNKST